MVSSENVSELLFEFSNPSRLDILLLLKDLSVKASQIARAVDQTIQETSRHLQRLTKAQLVVREVEGVYSLTPLGKLLMELIPEVNFLVVNSEFFTTHDPSCIPKEYRHGLGLIQDYNSAGHVMDAFRQTEDLIRNAEEFIWIHSDQVLSSSVPLIEKAIERGVDFRVILPKSLKDQGVHIGIHSDVDHSQRHDRFTDSVNLIIVMSEKVALLAFPAVDGSHDYCGFSFSNDLGLKWCKDMYLHFWNHASS